MVLRKTAVETKRPILALILALILPPILATYCLIFVVISSWSISVPSRSELRLTILSETNVDQDDFSPRQNSYL